MRSGAFGDVWDAMTPLDRRKAFIGDLIIGFGGAAILYFGLTYLVG